MLIVKRTALALAAAFALVYAGDALWLRFRMGHPGAGQAFGSVQMERLYAIPQKSGKTEYEFDARQPEVMQTCVRSLFPHFNYSACWYLARKSQKPIPMMILPSVNAADCAGDMALAALNSST